MLPAVEKAKPVRQYELGGRYSAILLTNCVSDGPIEYAHMLAIYDRDAPRRGQQKLPAIVITAETNPLSKRAGAYFLCAFHGGVHLNFGDSPDYGHLNVFEPLALEKAREYFQITELPRLVREVGTERPLKLNWQYIPYVSKATSSQRVGKLGTEAPLGLAVAREQIKISEWAGGVEATTQVPSVERAKLVREHNLGSYTARLLTKCVNVDKLNVEYVHMLAIYDHQDPQSDQPVAVITAETNPMAKSQGQYFLCAFYEGRHIDFGSSPGLIKLAVFERMALEKAQERFKTAEPLTLRGFATEAVIALVAGVGVWLFVIMAFAMLLGFLDPRALRGNTILVVMLVTGGIILLLCLGMIRYLWREFKRGSQHSARPQQ